MDVFVGFNFLLELIFTKKKQFYSVLADRNWNNQSLTRTKSAIGLNIDTILKESKKAKQAKKNIVVGSFITVKVVDMYKNREG